VSDRILVGTRKGLFSVDRRGVTGNCQWIIGQAGFLGDPVSMVLFDARDSTIYAALNLGHFGVKLHRSTDGGKNWEECAAPAFPEQAQPAIPAAEPPTGPRGDTVQQIWSLEAGGADQPGVLWAGTIPGGLFRSGDRGSSWELVQSLWERPERREWFGGGAEQPGIHSVCVHPNDSRHITVGVSCGGVWQTTDGGQSWDVRADGMFAAYMPPEQAKNPNIQDPHRVIQCAADPNAFWAQHHNGIFRSTDGCKSWQDVPSMGPSVFGFAVAVHPGDPETAWFVPAIKDERRVPVDGALVVTRTRDGGKSCAILREGLPQQHAYDLVYRHCLDVDESGSRLAFGSTTGSAWVSENQGDTWQCVSTHLPPINCVRFVY
jgi:photosystem II stability/assembly factor-like uncharacterized protein